MIRKVGVVEVKYFKYREKGHKYKECLLQMRKERTAYVARPQKAQKKERLVHSMKRKAQERRLRRIEEEEATCCYVTSKFSAKDNI